MFSRLRTALAGPRPTAFILIFAVAALVLAATAASATDTQPPTSPAPVNATSVGQSSATINWGASSDNVAVLGYHLYKNGASMGIVPAATLSKTFAYLACGTTNTFGVSAYDTRYNTSAAQTISVSTSACGTGTPPVSDTTPPSNPTGLSTSGITSSAVTLTWAASTDNVAVSGYDVYLNGAKTATVGGTSYTFGGLPCNTSRPVGVVAHDAAGNNSAEVTISAQTAACGGSGGSGGSGSGGYGLAAGLSAISTVTSSGVTRYFKTYKPAGLNDAAAPGGVPLVLWNPGSTGCPSATTFLAQIDCDLGTSATSGRGQIFLSNWPAKADSAGFILVFPEENPTTCFNNGVCGGTLGPNLGQYLKDLVAQMKTKANINASKIYMAGFSQGAFITMGAECEENGNSGAVFVGTNDYSGVSALFRGFGVQAGAQGAKALASHSEPIVANACNSGTTPKLLIQVTSKGDSTVPADPGGSGAKLRCSQQTAGLNCELQATTTAAAYKSKWGCSLPVVKTLPAGGPYLNNTTTVYSGCAGGGAYEWASLGSGSGSLGPTHSLANYNTAADVPTLMWNFWSTH